MPGVQARPHGELTDLDAVALRRWAVLVRGALAQRRDEIDDLNVFPVPDGDTGTNLFLTVDGALDRNEATSASDPAGTTLGAGELLARFASSLLWAARGNSGVILSQLVRGVAEAARGRPRLDAADLAHGLRRADEMAWQAVTDPQAGTILSVSRAAAEAGSGAVDHGLHAVALAAYEAAATALTATPTQLQVLADAGVVDAGGAGYLVVLECLERVCAGDEGLASSPRRAFPGRPAAEAADRSAPRLAPAGPSFEVMYLLAAEADRDVDTIERLRARLIALGDSVLVVGGDGEWNVHVHVDGLDEVGAAVEAGIEAGRPHRVRITTLDLVDRAAARRQAPPTPGRGEHPASALVACVAGPGLAGLFREAGAEVVLSRPSQRASTGQIIAAIRAQHAAGAGGVIVLPGDPDAALAAAAAVRAASDDAIDAHVVRARAAVQSVAALAVFEPSAAVGANVLAMASAAAATRHGAVTTATRSALTSAGPCEPGDVLGVVDGDIVLVGDDDVAVSHQVVDRLLSSGGELLTVIVGADAPDRLAESVTAAARGRYLGLDVSVIEGGQPVYTVLLGVE